MTASKNTLLALGLMSLAFAGGSSVQGASFIGCGGSSCEASCGAAGNATCDATCNPAGCGCEAGCGVGCNGNGGNFKASDLCHEPDCSSCTKVNGVEGDPLFGDYTPFFKDLCDNCSGYRVQTEISALILHRSTPGVRPVLFDPNTGGDLFDSSNQEFNFAAGPRISFTALDCDGWGFEVNYFSVDGWSADNDVSNQSLPSGTANLMIDRLNDLSLTDAHFESTSAVYSLELNFRRPLFGNFALLAGFRWMDLTDKYLAQGTSATTANTASESILTHNHMYGFQLGSDGILAQKADRWKIKGFVKGGIFLNNADQATSLTDPGNFGSLAVNNNQIVASFFGEAGLIGYFQITKHLSASGGYQVMFANNVAQPTNQLSGTDLANSSAKVDTSAGLFYHGATAGIEVTW